MKRLGGMRLPLKQNELKIMCVHVGGMFLVEKDGDSIAVLLVFPELQESKAPE